jgi:hypothetical protein
VESAEDEAMAAVVVENSSPVAPVLTLEGDIPGPFSPALVGDSGGLTLGSPAFNPEELATQMGGLGLEQATMLPGSPSLAIDGTTVNPAPYGPASGKVTVPPVSPCLAAPRTTSSPPRTPPATGTPLLPPRLHPTPTRFYSRRRIRHARR